MEKSKFKTVKFKPFDMELYYWNQEYWISHLCYGGDSNNSVRFTDSFIESYPEFFEVEKAEREFEHGAYYRLKYEDGIGHTVGIYCEPHNKFYVVGSSILHNKYEFKEIGEKIEL